MNDAIGGYFSLELPWHEEYHKDAIRLNTGRNCLEYILRSRNYKKVYIPYYTCEVIFEPFEKTNTAYEYYHVNLFLEIVENIQLKEGEALLYTNYYGLKQRYVETLSEKYGHRLIVDNTQAFFAKPMRGCDTFYTCRKFFGVPDGAYLYTDKKLDIKLERDISYDRMTFLNKRIDVSAEAAYSDFREESRQLVNCPIRQMSTLTLRLMSSIDYEVVSKQRQRNYKYLHQALSHTNCISLDIEDSEVPMVYPYYVANGVNLRNQLIEKKIFIARYWPNVLEWTTEESIEYQLTLNLLPIPIDQRYGISEMDFIIDTILHG